MPDFYFFLPTGGEPFLRGDLPEIVSLFARHCGIRSAGVPTNGSLTDATVAAVEKILADNPSLEFAVDVSFDGVGDAHDRIRGVPGLFDSAVKTFKALQQIEKSNPRFNLNAAITVSAFNQDDLPALLHWVVADLGARNINHLLARGAPRDPSAAAVNPERYKELNRLLEEYTFSGKLRGYHGYSEADGINALKLVRQKAIERTADTGVRQARCRAGSLGAVIGPSGDVFPCELLDIRMGSLRESEYDLEKIWCSKAASEARQKVREGGCVCTYECFMTLNVLFDPLWAARIAAKFAALKTAGTLRRGT